MAYVTPPTTKKNALAAVTTAAILVGDVSIPISDCSICYDVAGNLITQGYVLRNPNSLTTPPPEEITITGCSVAYGTGGPGNITGVVRAVNYDANTGGVSQGAAYAWPAGTVISAMISIGVYNILINDIIALSSGKLAGWTALGTPTYASSSTFTLVGDQTALLYPGRALKYTISGVIYPGRVVSATYSSPNTTVTVRGWPVTSNLTAVSYGDDSRTGTVTFVIPNYYEPSATAATMLNDRVRLAGGYTWSNPSAYIIGLDLQHITNDGSTAPNVNGVVNGNLLSTSNTNAGPAMSSTSLISTGIDLNTTLANILISTGQKLECKVTVNSAAAYQNATDLSITYIWVDIS